jgi:H+/gluconate symporter-like permease
MYYASILIAITGLVVYQLAVKSAPKGVNPWWMLAVAYAAAAVMCAAAAPVWNRLFVAEPFPMSSKNIMAAVYIGVAAILIVAAGRSRPHRPSHKGRRSPSSCCWAGCCFATK